MRPPLILLRDRPASVTPAGSASSPTPRAGRRATSSRPPWAAWPASCIAARWRPTPRPGDGAGLLFPIPAAIFGAGHGVANLFVRGEDDPSARIEEAGQGRRAHGRELAGAAHRRGPTRRAGPASRPRFLQAILSTDGAQWPRAIGLPSAPAHRQRRRHLRASTWPAARSAPSSTRDWSPPTPCPRTTSTWRTPRWSAISPSSISASRPTPCPRGSGPSRSGPCATTARSTPSRATWAGCGPGPCSGTDAAGLGDEELFHPVLDDSDSDIGPARQRGRAARPGRQGHPPRRRHVDPRGMGGCARPRPRGALLLPVPLLAGRAVGRPRGRHLHRRHRRRRRPRPQRAAADALRRLRRRPGGGAVPRRARSTSTVTAPSAGAAWARARCCSSIRAAGVLEDHDCKVRIAAAAPYGHWTAEGLRPVSSGEPVQETPESDQPGAAPGDPRLHRGGTADDGQAHGQRRQGADLLHGRRHPAAAPGGPPPTHPPLLAAALRPGHQPGHRPSAGAAGHEPAHAPRTPPRPPVGGRGSGPAGGDGHLLPVPLGGRGADQHRDRTLPRRPPQRHLSRRRRARRPARPPSTGCEWRRSGRWRSGQGCC